MSTSLSLIGGPMNGRVVDSPGPAGWVDVEGSRYIVHHDGTRTREDVGIFLPLYARVLAARRRGGAPWRPPAI
jgi:hypothetical protein